MTNDRGAAEQEQGRGGAEACAIAEDERTLASLGYKQELLRRMSGFSNFAISLSIICILAGGITSFQLGYSSVGGASIGLGWPLCCLFSLIVALTMAEIASAYPTAGGLYHWASMLGGRGWGWVTAWFNLTGLITVLSAINVGNYRFTLGSFGPLFGVHLAELSPLQAALAQAVCVFSITASQALVNHLGIKLTTRLTDFSGYWILLVSTTLTGTLLLFAPHLDLTRLVTFTNSSGAQGGGVWPATESMGWLFLLGFLLPAYTITGFDASAHTSEETVGAARNVPKAIVRSVVISGLFGWIMLSAIVLAAPDPSAAAAKGEEAFAFIVSAVLPRKLGLVLYAAIALAQYLCGLATVTSASRMAYAFARDGGLPFSRWLCRVSDRYKTPAIAIWAAALLSALFTVYTPVYSTITAVCTIFLYISYVLPTALGFLARGRSWTSVGPFSIGRWYRPLSALAVVGCIGLFAVSVQPPNEKALQITLVAVALSAIVWFGFERRRFAGPPG